MSSLPISDQSKRVEDRRAVLQAVRDNNWRNRERVGRSVQVGAYAVAAFHVYVSFLDNHIIPRWGDAFIRDVQPRPVELWLRQLPLSPKSKTHVRSLMHGLLEFAMWAGLIDIARNPFRWS